MISLDEILEREYDAVSMSYENLKKVVDEATKRVLSGSASPIAFDISRATSNDDMFILSFSYNGFGYMSTEVYINAEN